MFSFYKRYSGGSDREITVQVLTTPPMVPYRLHMRGGAAVDMQSPLDFPRADRQAVEGVGEPTVDATILAPPAHTGAVLQLCSTRRGDLLVRRTRCRRPANCCSSWR